MSDFDPTQETWTTEEEYADGCLLVSIAEKARLR